MAEPSEHHSRFWSPATQIALSAQNSQIIQNIAGQTGNATAGLRRRRLIRKSGHPSSAESLSENVSPLGASTAAVVSVSETNINLDEIKEAVDGLDKRLSRHIDEVRNY